MTDDTPLQDVNRPHAADIHKTDVLMMFSDAQGASWYSCVSPANALGRVLVQNQDGVQFWASPSDFARRYSLQDSGKFNLHWRVSPINAVPGYHSHVRPLPARQQPDEE